MRTYYEITHHNVPAIKFRALQTQYPTGQYVQSYNQSKEQWLAWFVLEIDGITITWYRDWFNMEEE